MTASSAHVRRANGRLTITTPEEAAVLGTVLSIWAHPDDETYLSAGLMALSRRAGNRVVCVSATRGEHGTNDPVRWPPARLSRTRDHEVAAAMAVIGVDDHRGLDFEDGTLADIDAAVGEAIVRTLIADVAPDTIVTFGPDGMTGHPDHCTIAAWVRAAADGSTSTRVLQATTTAGFVDEFADIHDAMPLFGPGTPLRTPETDITVVVQLDDDFADLKLAALRSQATQVQPVIDVIGVDRLRQWWQTETFREARADA